VDFFRWLAQLGEVKAICDALFQARINQLRLLSAANASQPEDTAGAVSDYLNQKSVTNDLAVLTPYEIKFPLLHTGVGDCF